MISNWYKISKKRIGNKLSVVKDALTIVPKITPGEPVTPMKIYRDVGDSLLVPIHWGKANFGDADKRVVSGNTVSFPKFPDPHHPNAPEGQAEFMADVLAACNTHAQFIAEAGTGTGKTVVGLNTIARVGIEGLVIVPTDRLVRQWKEQAVDKLGLDESQIGMVKQDVCDYMGKHVTIASMQSLECRQYPDEFYQYHGIVLYDECHKIAAQKMSAVFGLFHARLQICLTATLKRRDGRHRVVTLWYGNPVVQAKGMKPLPLLVTPFAIHHTDVRQTIIPKIPNVLPVLDRATDFKNVFGVNVSANDRGLCLTGKDLTDHAVRAPIFKVIDQLSGFNHPHSESYYFTYSPFEDRNSAVHFMARKKNRNEKLTNIINALYGKGSVVLGISDSVRQLQNIQKYLLALGIPTQDVCIFADQLYTGEKRLSIKLPDGFNLDNLKNEKRNLEEQFNLKVAPSKRSISVSGAGLNRQVFRHEVATAIAELGFVTPEQINAGLVVKDKKVKQSTLTIDAMLSNENMRIYLATYGVMELGIDVPWLDVGIDLTPRATGVQPIGRVRRRYGNKQLSRWFTPLDFGLSSTIERINNSRLNDYASSGNVVIKETR